MKQDGKDRGNTSLREVKRTPQSDLPRWLCLSERKKYKLGSALDFQLLNPCM
jgi:hypothetical protein